MVGFGFMDNFVLIIAGDWIDGTLGVYLGISTMCAAALGNIISDLCGVPAGNFIEALADRLNLPRPHLTPAQEILPVVRHAKHGGIGLGLVLGCILGMCPLLFMEPDKSIRIKARARLKI